jgi:agmatinase
MNNNATYAGIPHNLSTLENAKIVLIPVPYDGTSTWKKGADKGPEAFLKASENMELYDIETQTEVYKKGVHLAPPPITGNETPEAMVNTVEETVKNYLSRKKFVTLFGGEHSISIGSIRAFAKNFERLTVLQLDAHADLRPTYESSPFNHACALHEASQTTNLIQVGIRSMDGIEKDYLNPENTFFAHELANDPYWMDRALDNMTENIYITIDLDGFDPSILPATGTPEPGGLLWYETLEFLKEVFKEKNVVGFDIVELCPQPALYASDFLAAKLYYKMLSYKFQEEAHTYPHEDEDFLAPSSKKPQKFSDDDE